MIKDFIVKKMNNIKSHVNNGKLQLNQKEIDEILKQNSNTKDQKRIKKSEKNPNFQTKYGQLNSKNVIGKSILLVAGYVGISADFLILHFKDLGIEVEPTLIFSKELWGISYEFLSEKYLEKKKKQFEQKRLKKTKKKKLIHSSNRNKGSIYSGSLVNSDTTPFPKTKLEEKFKPSYGKPGNYSKLILIRTKT
jgi:hypothetical protein